MNLLKKQGFYNSIILYAGTALGFFNLVVLFQRILTLEEIGFFAIMNTITLLYAQIASVGINNIIFKYLPDFRSDDKKHGGFVTFVIAWCVISFVLFTLVFLFFQNSIIRHYSHKPGSELLVRYFYYLIPLSFLTMVYTVIESLAITVFKNVLSSFLREVLLRVFTLVSVLLIEAALITYHDFLSIYLAANIAMIAILLFYVYRGRDFKLGRISPQIVSQKKEFVKYGFYTLLSSTSAALILNLDNIMLMALSVKNELPIIAIYTTFFAIALAISLPAKALNRTSLQIIAQAWSDNDLPKIGKIYYKTSVMQMLIGSLLFIGIVVNRNFLINVLLHKHKDEFTTYFNVFIVVGLGFLTDITGGVNGYIINLSKHYKFTTYFIVGSVFFCVAANWLLIPRIGMMGAAIAYFMTMFILNFLYWIYVKLKFGLQPFGRTHVSIIIISIITLLTGLYLPLGHDIYIDLILRSAVVAVIYLSLAYLLKISDDVNQLIDSVFKFTRK
ncbi:lipopolysaccharide biosynthesis protein [Mucilaginibacter sp. UR6-11]|uniref:lipopolysaccharide biosynthesis protein n=1 Tax=Mucilaginibacter sp. UR6-11 TaxID=1435644 RepID=UPI001E45C47B|nr:polysaccharide biosynthesis C-terminal domain-containing protein [Mucilaginibacter sp. UR6-11]MCC8425267.1 polysaccharide biosynthesis C-terminal domain-containing protein [Mucilaginibacter sp. UR6-11]